MHSQQTLQTLLDQVQINLSTYQEKHASLEEQIEERKKQDAKAKITNEEMFNKKIDKIKEQMKNEHGENEERLHKIMTEIRESHTQMMKIHVERSEQKMKELHDEMVQMRKAKILAEKEKFEMKMMMEKERESGVGHLIEWAWGKMVSKFAPQPAAGAERPREEAQVAKEEQGDLQGEGVGGAEREGQAAGEMRAKLKGIDSGDPHARGALKFNPAGPLLFDFDTPRSAPEAVLTLTLSEKALRSNDDDYTIMYKVTASDAKGYRINTENTGGDGEEASNVLASGFLSRSGRRTISLRIIMLNAGSKGSRSWWDRAVFAGRETASARALFEKPGSKPDEILVQYACYEPGYRHVQELRLIYGAGVAEELLITGAFGDTGFDQKKAKVGRLGRAFESRKFTVLPLDASERKRRESMIQVGWLRLCHAFNCCSC